MAFYSLGSVEMGRGKVQLKRIEDNNRRQVSFSKRRSGLIKKASELSILCDVDVGLFIFSGRGRLYEFCSGNSLRKILDHYQTPKDAEVAGGSVQESQKLPVEHMNIGKGTDPLQMLQSYFQEQKVEQLDVTELSQLENQLDAILMQTRMRKSQLMMEAVAALHGQRKDPGKENQFAGKFTEKEMDEMVNDGGAYDGGQRPQQAAEEEEEEEEPVVGTEIYTWDNTNHCITTVMTTPGGPAPHL